MTVAERLDAEARRRKDTTLRRQPFVQEQFLGARELEAMRREFRARGAVSAVSRVLAGRDSRWICSI